MPPVSSAPSSSLIDRVQHYVADNKQTVLIGAAAAVVAAGGVGYYLYSTSSPSTSRTVDDGEDGEGTDAASKKKRKSKKKKTVKDADGPLLEERKPKVDSPSSPELTAAQISEMSTAERQAMATSLKSQGNTAYQARKFEVAVTYYTRAIEVAVTPEAVFYSNRAACYVNFSPPNHDLVVSDCGEALKLDPMYIKALNRRATALEALGRDEEALRDFTAATILEKFQNESTSISLEKVLKKIAQRKTTETLLTREPRLPSFTFVSAYLAAFRTRSPPTLPDSPGLGDETLLLAWQALEAANYIHGFTLVNEALEQGLSWSEGRAVALNLRGTFKFLVGDTPGAKEDLQESLDLLPSYTQTWVKMASVHMELGDTLAAFAAFDAAIEQDQDDPDIYYHRGQVHFIMQQYTEAAEDYNKSTALDDTFVFSHIQFAVAQYKKGEVQSSMAAFRKTMKSFPDRSEPQNYYGELLLDTQRFSDAIEKFDRAIELEKQKKPPINVLALVNKGLALYQWKQDIAGAQRFCEEALSIDAECDAAIATLAQLYLQSSRLDDAISMFERHSKIARTATELEQTYTFECATRAQKEFAKNYPEKAAELEQIAQAMR